jgi:hypothetical protein
MKGKANCAISPPPTLRKKREGWGTPCVVVPAEGWASPRDAAPGSKFRGGGVRILPQDEDSTAGRVTPIPIWSRLSGGPLLKRREKWGTPNFLSAYT